MLNPAEGLRSASKEFIEIKTKVADRLFGITVAAFFGINNPPELKLPNPLNLVEAARNIIKAIKASTGPHK